MDSTTQKGFKILEILAASDAARGISELSRETGLTKSNLQRILTTLCELGYAEKDPNSNRYFATLRLWEIGIPVLNRNRAVRAARSSLKALRANCGETTVLCLREGLDVVYLDKIESESPIRLSCAVGTRLPLYSTASGRVMAADLSDTEMAQLLERFSAANGAPPSELRERLKTAAGRGYDTSESGYRAGINSIAAPIRDDRGIAMAAIAISGPEERLDAQALANLRPLILDEASKISVALGYAGQTA
jgi:IclR family KDG regulon transcriptional repressor